MKFLHLTEKKAFTQDQVESLFQSVNWVSGNYPTQLYHALMNSSTVVSVWDSNELIGLARALDDGGMLAYIHYVLVRPEYQGRGVAKSMIEFLKAKYASYMYIQLMPESSKNAPFYEKLGFEQMPDGVPMIRVNYPQSVCK